MGKKWSKEKKVFFLVMKSVRKTVAEGFACFSEGFACFSADLILFTKHCTKQGK